MCVWNARLFCFPAHCNLHATIFMFNAACWCPNCSSNFGLHPKSPIPIQNQIPIPASDLVGSRSSELARAKPSLTGPVGSAGNCTIIIDFELCLTRNVDVLPASVQRSAFGVLHPTDAGKPAMRFHVFNPTPLWPTRFDSWPGLARDCIGNLFATEVKYLIIANTRSAKNQPTKRV